MASTTLSSSLMTTGITGPVGKGYIASIANARVRAEGVYSALEDNRGQVRMDKTTQTEIEAAIFRRLLEHLDNNKQVQNIELMILADFCRNCPAKWYVAAAKERGESIDYESAREIIYGMPYSEWKALYQTKATPEQMAAFDARQQNK